MRTYSQYVAFILKYSIIDFKLKCSIFANLKISPKTLGVIMKILFTEDLKEPIYLDALSLRKTVFVEEQMVPLALEIDELEARCVHFVLYDQEIPVATCRLLKQENQTVKLQRMAVLAVGRKKGYGRIIMEAAEVHAIHLKQTKMILGAQVSAIGFYQKLGFKTYGEEFLDAGIPHFMMEKNLPTN